ncbi:MAG: glucosamine-6-phosphate isomerase [Fidelibacterota bacterium]
MIDPVFQSDVEQTFWQRSGLQSPSSRIPFIVVNNFPQLGLISALRFLEWVEEHPEGVVSLPTGKTPEYFIKWVQYLLKNWARKDQDRFRRQHGFDLKKKPSLKGLHFIQMDEFYPINPQQHNSFYYYVKRFYLRGFGLNPQRALLMNCDRIPRFGSGSLADLFPENRVDLSLRFREPTSLLEERQQKTIFLVDQWCNEYEERLRSLGGIGFFLGGIGPDGHIAFNVRGSDHHSTTRLTNTNFETQAAAAVDLGGIEISRNRLVLTIGLNTIMTNPQVVPIIFAAGAAKAKVVKQALENPPSVEYPATALQGLPQARFYLTQGAASQLEAWQQQEFQNTPWTEEKTQRVIINLCKRQRVFGSRLTLKKVRKDPLASLIPNLSKKTIPETLQSIQEKVEKTLNPEEDQVFLHTGPHHDDIMLGFLPHIIHLVRSPRNHHHFAIMTSGFTSVTNRFLQECLQATLRYLRQGRIEMTTYANFFIEGYRWKWDKDVYHYLDRVASNNAEGRQRGLSHRIVRILVEIYGIESIPELEAKLVELLEYLDHCYDGEMNPPNIQRLKGMIREFEEELVWARYGVRVRDIHHLRLGFYTGDIFTETPKRKRDVEPILTLLKTIEPTVISLALDPEGSGPDTHYKVLQAMAEALRLWQEERDLSHLRIWGYRNVWYRLDAAEADLIIPVSLNSMAVLRQTFMTSYLSQREASFPSYELDGPFCDLTQKIWVEQHQDLQLVLGRDYWYQNPHPRLRAAHGAIYLKELSVGDFLKEARRLEESMEGQVG